MLGANSMFRFRLALVLLVWSAGAQEPPEQTLKHAIEAHQSGDVEHAIAGYRKYLQVHPDAADVRSNLGAALAANGRYDDAILEYQKALKGAPRNPPVIRLNLAIAYYKAGFISKAAIELNALHAVEPANRQVITLLADCWLRQEEDAKVIALLTPIDKQDPKDLAIAYMLGTALLRSKQIERGQLVIDRILRNSDSAEAHLLMGTVKLNALEYNAAIADLQRAVELNPQLPDVYSYLGRAHMDSGDMASARIDFQKELQQDPNDFESNLNLAVLLKLEQDYEGAMKLLDRALRVRPGDLRVLYQVATVQLASGKTEEARATLEDVLKQSPDFVEGHISLATIYYHEKRKADGDRERAIVQRLNAEKQAKEAAAKPQ
jgi:tetratricopeptide (TPR) repeat protein